MTVGITPANKAIFAPIVAVALVVVGALSLLSYAAFAAYAPDLSGETDGRPNALSRSAVGFAAFARFLREQDIPVVISRGLNAAAFAKASLIVLTPSLGDSKGDILGVTNREPKLIVLPKWIVLPDPQHPGWVSKVGLYSTNDVAEKLLTPLSPSTRLVRGVGVASVSLHNGLDGTDANTGPIESLQSLTGGNWTGYVVANDRRTIVSRLVGSTIYVLTDPDLLDTHGLRDLNSARVALAVIQSLRANDGPVIFDVTLSGYRRSPNILRLIFEPPLLGATLCTLLAALLLGVCAVVRFGAPEEGERIFALGKQALANNSAALIAMTHREHRILPRYAAAIKRQVGRAVGIPTDQQGTELTALLERRGATDDARQSLSNILADVETAENDAGALVVARRLYRWRKEMIHER